MIQRRVVKRYAAALFQAASEAEVIDRIESDLGLIAYVMEGSPDLLKTITSPLIVGDIKKVILHDVFTDKVDKITIKYMELLVDKRREEALLKTEFEYVLLANEARGIINADIRTAVRMSDDQVNAITAKLESLTGKKIHLIKTIDPKLIGGVEVRIGDEVIDGSIRGQLAELRKRFAQE